MTPTSKIGFKQPQLHEKFVKHTGPLHSKHHDSISAKQVTIA